MIPSGFFRACPSSGTAKGAGVGGSRVAVGLALATGWRHREPAVPSAALQAEWYGGIPMSGTVAVAGLLACAAPASAQGVATVSIPDGVTCETCRITLTPLVALGDEDGPGSFTMPPASVRVDGRGRYWVVGANA